MSLNDDVKKKLTEVESQKLEEYGDLVRRFAFQWAKLGYSKEANMLFCQKWMQGLLEADNVEL